MPPPAGEACQLNAKTFHKMKMTTSGLQGVVENLNNSLKVLDAEIAADAAGKHEYGKVIKALEIRRAELQARHDDNAAWSAMCAEGRRLQERADFEARVSAYVVNYTSAREPRDLAPVAESQSLEMEDTQPYESQDYYNDANEPWQEIDEDGNLPISQPSLPLPAVHGRSRSHGAASFDPHAEPPRT